jgi:hypothetical protein
MADPFQQSFDLLISKFPRRYAVKSTKFLKGLVSALATGDAYIEETVEATRDNLIAVTATGRFLDRPAAVMVSFVAKAPVFLIRTFKNSFL